MFILILLPPPSPLETSISAMTTMTPRLRIWGVFNDGMNDRLQMDNSIEWRRYMMRKIESLSKKFIIIGSNCIW